MKGLPKVPSAPVMSDYDLDVMLADVLGEDPPEKPLGEVLGKDRAGKEVREGDAMFVRTLGAYGIARVEGRYRDSSKGDGAYVIVGDTISGGGTSTDGENGWLVINGSNNDEVTLVEGEDEPCKCSDCEVDRERRRRG